MDREEKIIPPDTDSEAKKENTSPPMPAWKNEKGEFQCPWAPRGEHRCSPAICDCFIDLYPDDPFGLHPEAFRVMGIDDEVV